MIKYPLWIHIGLLNDGLCQLTITINKRVSCKSRFASTWESTWRITADGISPTFSTWTCRCVTFVDVCKYTYVYYCLVITNIYYYIYISCHCIYLYAQLYLTKTTSRNFLRIISPTFSANTKCFCSFDSAWCMITTIDFWAWIYSNKR